MHPPVGGRAAMSLRQCGVTLFITFFERWSENMVTLWAGNVPVSVTPEKSENEIKMGTHDRGPINLTNPKDVRAACR